MLLLLTTLAHAQDCLPVSSWVDRAHQDLIQGDYDAVKQSLEAAERSMDCDPVDPSELGSYWLVKGGLLALTNDEPGASLAFAASKRVQPDGWDESLGGHLHDLYLAAKDGPEVTFTLDTNQTHALVNGEKPKSWPAVVPAGENFVQILRYEPGQAYGHKLFVAPPGMELNVLTGLPELPRPDRTAQHRKAAPWLIAAATSLAASGASATVALLERERGATAPTIPAANQSESLQKVGAWGTVGFAGAAAITTGVWIAVR